MVWSPLFEGDMAGCISVVAMCSSLALLLAHVVVQLGCYHNACRSDWYLDPLAPNVAVIQHVKLLLGKPYDAAHDINRNNVRAAGLRDEKRAVLQILFRRNPLDLRPVIGCQGTVHCQVGVAKIRSYSLCSNSPHAVATCCRPLENPWCTQGFSSYPAFPFHEDGAHPGSGIWAAVTLPTTSPMNTTLPPHNQQLQQLVFSTC
jgi:hypothetical protein